MIAYWTDNKWGASEVETCEDAVSDSFEGDALTDEIPSGGDVSFPCRRGPSGPSLHAQRNEVRRGSGHEATAVQASDEN